MYRFKVAMLLWIVAWVDLAQSLVCIILLGLYVPTWSLKAQGWMLDKFEEWSLQR